MRAYSTLQTPTLSYILVVISEADVVPHQHQALRSLSYLNHTHLKALLSVVKRLASAVQRLWHPILQHRHNNENEKWYLLQYQTIRQGI